MGLIGVGKMGLAMAANMRRAGIQLVVYDISRKACEAAERLGCLVASSPRAVAEQTPTVLSVLPNDKILWDSTLSAEGIAAGLKSGGIHVSCSTVAPETSRKLAEKHKDFGHIFVGAPVFARPDGIAAKNGTWCLSGPSAGVEVAKKILQTTCSGIYEFGEDPGAANVVKLCGNFMIASAIESIGESLALAENNGLDREQVMKMFRETIFNCLIYKGYGNRVASRKHFQDVEHPGFALELGLKDIALVLETASKSSPQVPMPLASLLANRLTASKNLGRADQDWSAIGLHISEEAGVDVSEIVKNPRPE